MFVKANFKRFTQKQLVEYYFVSGSENSPLKKMKMILIELMNVVKEIMYFIV